MVVAGGKRDLLERERERVKVVVMAFYRENAGRGEHKPLVWTYNGLYEMHASFGYACGVRHFV